MGIFEERDPILHPETKGVHRSQRTGRFWYGIMQRHLNHTAEHVLDPTMLLTPADYRALIGEGGAEKYANKITAFILDRSDDKLAALKKSRKF